MYRASAIKISRTIENSEQHILAFLTKTTLYMAKNDEVNGVIWNTKFLLRNTIFF